LSPVSWTRRRAFISASPLRTCFKSARVPQLDDAPNNRIRALTCVNRRDGERDRRCSSPGLIVQPFRKHQREIGALPPIAGFFMTTNSDRSRCSTSRLATIRVGHALRERRPLRRGQG
jgi:hypothetical protein